MNSILKSLDFAHFSNFIGLTCACLLILRMGRGCRPRPARRSLHILRRGIQQQYATESEFTWDGRVVKSCWERIIFCFSDMYNCFLSQDV